tara:strand:+ start:3400 stop:3801 length:402 start_codon:yes stop_codon:yes gene_type:complete
MKATKLSIEFVQGANKLNVSNVQIDSVKINEISGTLANKILSARANMKRYGMSIKGFSFNKKFDIILSIDGCEPMNVSGLFGGLFDAKITLQANANSFERFKNIIHDMTFCAMTSANSDVLELSEVSTQKLIG